MRYLGVDLAWTDRPDKSSPPSGVVALDPSGTILEAGRTVGVDETLRWIADNSRRDCLVFVDAPLVVTNASGQRPCETQVGKRYGRWNVSANSTNLASPRLGGVRLRQLLELEGWQYDDGLDGPPTGGRVVSECYPYTTIVGVEELGYEVERPRYKRRPKSVRAVDFRPIRAAACDQLIGRIDGLRDADVPLLLSSHPLTASLVDTPSPSDDESYKQREDVIDAVLSAWTAALWHRFGLERCQVLGAQPGMARPAATIIAPARPSQRW